MILERASQNSRRTIPTSILVLVLIIVPRLLATPQPPQATITLAFNPPDGTRFIETQDWTRNLLSDGKLIDGARRQGKVEYYIRRMAGGYSVTVRPLKVPIEASREMRLMIQDLFANATLTYHLDAHGQLVRVIGADQAMRKVFETVPDKERPQFEKMYAMATQGKSADALAAAHWTNRGVLGVLAGKSLQFGTPYKSTGAVPLPFGLTLNADVTMDISPSRQCPGCVGIVVEHKAREPKLGAALSDFLRTSLLSTLRDMDSPQMRAKRREAGAPLDPEKLVPALKFGEFTFQGTAIRVLDAATGLPRRETSIQKIRGTLSVEGRQSTMEFAEGSENTYEYPLK